MKLLLTLFILTILNAQHYQELDKSLASAGIYSNLRGTDDSIKVVTSKLLYKAENQAKQSNAKIIFKSSPNVVLVNYENKEYCLGLKKQTEVKPLKYYQELSNLDEFSDYFSKLATGKNPDGKKLYEDCPKDCSFNFTVELTRKSDKYQTKIDTICGEARDKDDNQYLLSVGLKNDNK